MESGFWRSLLFCPCALISFRKEGTTKPLAAPEPSGDRGCPNHPTSATPYRCAIQVWVRKGPKSESQNSKELPFHFPTNVRTGFLCSLSCSQAKSLPERPAPEGRSSVPPESKPSPRVCAHQTLRCPLARHGDYSNPPSMWCPFKYLRRAFTSLLCLSKIMSEVHSKGEYWAQEFLISYPRFTKEGDLPF